MIDERFRWPTVAILMLCLLFGFIRQVRSEEITPLVQLSSLAGTFEQHILDDDGVLLSASTGTFAILKPHFFRWTVTAPGQLELVADGVYLWQHDADLETVLRTTLNPDAYLPLQLLLSDEAALAERFDIAQSATTIRLTPKSAGGLFESVELLFEAEQLVGINISDAASQRIEIALRIADNTTLSADDFQFDIPENVDVSVQD